AEAAQLAATILGVTDERAAAIAAESHGNPFFVHELTRAGGGPYGLDTIIQQRVAQLDAAARSLLELVAISARPVELDLLASASRGRDILAALTRLRAEHLIRARDANHERRIECYHDRIREAVAGSMATAVLRTSHLALASALERSSERADASAA